MTNVHIITGNPKLMSFSEAAAQLGISRTTLDRMVRRGVLREYANQLDRRVRLVACQDVERIANTAIVERSFDAELGPAAA